MKRMQIVLVLLLCAMAGTLYADTSYTVYGTYWEGDDSGRGAGVRVRKTLLAFLSVEGHAGYCEFTDSDTQL